MHRYIKEEIDVTDLIKSIKSEDTCSICGSEKFTCPDCYKECYFCHVKINYKENTIWTTCPICNNETQIGIKTL